VLPKKLCLENQKKTRETLQSIASTIRYPLLSLRECVKDGDMLKAIMFLSLAHLAFSATYLPLL